VVSPKGGKDTSKAKVQGGGGIASLDVKNGIRRRTRRKTKGKVQRKKYCGVEKKGNSLGTNGLCNSKKRQGVWATGRRIAVDNR